MRRALCVIGGLLAVYTACGQAGQDSAQFDIETLRAKGIAPEMADYFSRAPRFAAGTNYVSLYVNGVRLGTTAAAFDAQGQPCVDHALLDKAGIAWPHAQVPQGCLDLRQAWPQATITLRPGLNQVALLVPPQALAASAPATIYASGGSAALLNYHLFTMRSAGRYGDMSMHYADLESGLNLGDWVLRSRDNYFAQGARRQWQHQQAYGQKTVVPWKSTVQAGQLNLNSALFSAPSFTGVQAYPEDALTPAQAGAAVSGMAQTPARVEVRQSGVLIYATLVPAGPFTLNALPLLNTSADLQVTVIETTGERRGFVVPATAFASNFTPARKGLSLAVGRPRSFGGDTDALGSRWFMTATGTLPIGHANVSAGLMVADHYRALGAGVEGAPLPGASGYLRSVWAQDARVALHGARVESGLSAQLAPGWSASASVSGQTVGYRALSDYPAHDDSGYAALIDESGGAYDGAAYDEWGRSRLQFSASATYANDWLGGVSLGYNASRLFNGLGTHSVLLAWGHGFGRVHVSVNGELSDGYGASRRVYVSLNMPLGDASVGATLMHDGAHTQSALNMNQRLNEYVGYSVSATAQSPDARQSYTGNLSLLPKYTQMSLGTTVNSEGSRSYSAQLSGAVVLDGGEPLFSPYAVQDTYAVVSASRLAGARIQTPAGTVWTDYAGRAVAPGLTPYTESRLQLQARGLPRNVDVKNSVQVVRAGRGSVSHIAFQAIRMRRLLLSVRDPQDHLLPSGLGVVDGSGQFLTMVDFDSQVFIDASRLKAGIYVKQPDGHACRLEAQLGAAPDDALYEQAQAVCRPVDSIPSLSS